MQVHDLELVPFAFPVVGELQRVVAGLEDERGDLIGGLLCLYCRPGDRSDLIGGYLYLYCRPGERNDLVGGRKGLY